MPIGQIQGREMISPLLNQKVTFRGIVTGVIEDQNTRGRVFTRFLLKTYRVLKMGIPCHQMGSPYS